MTNLALLGSVAFFIAGGATVHLLPKLKVWLAGQWARLKADLVSRL